MPRPMFDTILDAARALREGVVTPQILVQDCLDIISLTDSKIKAWAFIADDEAKYQAESAHSEMKRGHIRGPLHGIPIGIKDIIDVADMPTSCGFEPWKNSIARQDATVVRRLKEAGAIILGKTVTTQFASFDPPPTRNPWNLGKTPGGSSSGSAAAVASGMCYAALGTQTGGSITRPAAFCGVASCKPTYGRASLDGIAPLATSMDHPGPMARSVRDLALVLQVISGFDSQDQHSSRRSVPAYGNELEDYEGWGSFVEVGGIFADLPRSEMLQAMDEVGNMLAESGHFLKSVALPGAFAEVLPRHRMVMAVEAASFHADRLRRFPKDYGPNIKQLLEEGLACSAATYAQTKAHQQSLRQEMLRCFGKADILVTPASLGVAPDSATTGDPAMNSPWSYTGFPTVSIPVKWTEEGLPLSVQLVGRPWSEANLFAAAAWLEEFVGLERRYPAVE